ncbi:MAG: hypothetical protein ACO3N2_11530 [Arenicellales bacterium]|jgi:hypothetical protein
MSGDMKDPLRMHKSTRIRRFFVSVLALGFAAIQIAQADSVTALQPTVIDNHPQPKPSDDVLWGLSGTELAVGGSLATTAAAAGYGLYQLAKGGETVATVVAALIAIEIASLAILGGIALKGAAAVYLWPSSEDDSPDAPATTPKQEPTPAAGTLAAL